MKKKEWVLREILYQVLEKGRVFLTQEFLSDKCEVSLGNVNYTLKTLESMSAIEKKAKGFTVTNPKKILIYWASIRNLTADIVFKTSSKLSVKEIEELMPPSLFTAYSGYKFLFGSVPSDYSEVFVYADPEEIKKRFPREGKIDNIFVLKMDEHLKKFRRIPIAQLYVDLWNINTWYAQEFLKALEARIDGILERIGH